MSRDLLGQGRAARRHEGGGRSQAQSALVERIEHLNATSPDTKKLADILAKHAVKRLFKFRDDIVHGRMARAGRPSSRPCATIRSVVRPYSSAPPTT
jgi:hypothetical protein